MLGAPGDQERWGRVWTSRSGPSPLRSVPQSASGHILGGGSRNGVGLGARVLVCASAVFYGWVPPDADRLSTGLCFLCLGSEAAGTGVWYTSRLLPGDAKGARGEFALSGRYPALRKILHNQKRKGKLCQIKVIVLWRRREKSISPEHYSPEYSDHVLNTKATEALPTLAMEDAICFREVGDPICSNT
ncbi:hypothetical protein GW7_21623 [Heterocephalus glaber]|uniref:Uncharacterized protein n=1 Tax=Heterocephalus glaber TaxID=10181 RepID=G5C5U9_HETGA|nr:hypothetical protein GW7_21623 [Heterocephalus glaber]